MKRLLLISGTQGAGKSSLARVIYKLARDASLKPSILKFADPLYEIHDATMNILAEYGNERKGIDRRFLQVVGTDWGRTYLGEDFWVNLLIPRVRNLLSHPDSIVIVDDVRFQNELDVSALFPSLTVRLDASEQARVLRAAKWGDVTHSSERSLDHDSGFDLVFDTTYAYLSDLGRQVWSKMMTGS
jgi:chloramphenicol 3-O-phosphotransferase